MGIPKVAVDASTRLDGWELSKLPDLEVYRHEPENCGKAEQGSPLVSVEIIDKIAKSFPDLRKNDISFGLVAAYLARMSENAEAVFPIQERGAAQGDRSAKGLNQLSDN